MYRSLAWAFALLTLAVALASNARGDDGSTDEALKRLFPDRDLSKAVIKIVDRANGQFVVGDSLEVHKDGTVRATNAVVIVIGGPNQSNGVCSFKAARVVLHFKKPIRMPSDMAGNKLTLATDETGSGLRIADN